MRESFSFDCVKLCPAVGKCCKKLTLAIEHTTGIRQLDYVTSLEEVQGILEKIKVPFKVVGCTSQGKWVFTCTVLGEDGLCTAYESRPNVCRDFKPGNPACLVSKDFIELVKRAHMEETDDLLCNWS